MSTTLTRNHERGTTVFSDKQSGIMVEWKGAGDPDGEDYQEVPSDLLEHPQFRRVIKKGVISVETNVAGTGPGLGLDDSLDLGPSVAGDPEARRKAAADEAEGIMATMDRKPDNDLVMRPCVAAGVNGKECGETSLTKASALHVEPPLCDQHSHLKSEFALVAPTDDKNDIRWAKVQ